MGLPGSPAAVQIDLDTSPPDLQVGRISPVYPMHELQVPYTTDEPASISATLTDADGNVLSLAHDGQSLSFPMNKYFTPGHADVDITATDDVGNAVTVNMGFQIYNDRFPLYIVADEHEAWIEADVPESLIVIDDNSAYLAVEPDYDAVVVG